jgi:hypothetical protein
MRDWILGLEKAATDHRPGVSPAAWSELETQGRVAPEELQDLYGQMSGATFSSGVTLFPLQGNGASVVGQSGDPDRWIFGEKQPDQKLFAAKKRWLTEQAGGVFLPDWVDTLESEDWVFGLTHQDTQETKVYRTLERLLSTLIPPVQTEEFGDITYARAMTAVQGALDSIRNIQSSSDLSDELLADEPSKVSRPAFKAKSKPKSKAKPKAKAKAKASSKKKQKPKAQAKSRKAAPKKAKKPARKAKPSKKSARKSAPKKRRSKR